MDNLDFRGAEMQRLLTDLKTVNQWLGGYGDTINALGKLLKAHPKYKEEVAKNLLYTLMTFVKLFLES